MHQATKPRPTNSFSTPHRLLPLHHLPNSDSSSGVCPLYNQWPERIKHRGVHTHGSHVVFARENQVFGWLLAALEHYRNQLARLGSAHNQEFRVHGAWGEPPIRDGRRCPKQAVRPAVGSPVRCAGRTVKHVFITYKDICTDARHSSGHTTHIKTCFTTSKNNIPRFKRPRPPSSRILVGSTMSWTRY